MQRVEAQVGADEIPAEQVMASRQSLDATAHAAAMRQLLGTRETRNLKYSISWLVGYDLDAELVARGCSDRGSVEVKRDRLLHAYLEPLVRQDVPWYEWDVAGRDHARTERKIERVVLGEEPHKKAKRRSEQQLRGIRPHSCESEDGDDPVVGSRNRRSEPMVPLLPAATMVTNTAQSVVTSQIRGSAVIPTASLPRGPIATAAIGGLGKLSATPARGLQDYLAVNPNATWEYFSA